MIWILYIALACIYLWLLGNGDSQTATIIKVFFMPILMASIWFKTKLKTRLSKYLILGVFWGWWGDIFLINKSHIVLFLLGLISFLIGHLFYIYLFSKEVSQIRKPHLLMNKPYLILPYLAFFIYSLNLFSGVTIVPIFPIYLYTFVILMMSLMAVNRFYAVNRSSWIAVTIGSLLFIGSDLMIAINFFIQPFEGSSLAIMTTYLLAQFLIIYGSLKNDRITTNTQF